MSTIRRGFGGVELDARVGMAVSIDHVRSVLTRVFAVLAIVAHG